MRSATQISSSPNTGRPGLGRDPRIYAIPRRCHHARRSRQSRTPRGLLFFHEVAPKRQRVEALLVVVLADELACFVIVLVDFERLLIVLGGPIGVVVLEPSPRVCQMQPLRRLTIAESVFEQLFADRNRLRE